ncbi:Uncharacterized protein OBRU01_24320, partial [Operophtera brumata]
CAAAVTDALGAAHITSETDGAGGGGADSRGESLLLPLLQGLLGGGGERLLAGLGAAPADVVADVRRSLGRLRSALAEPAAHPQARALLALADRLEDALDAADRLDGCRRRPRRRPRAARHTVGVTREELEQARRRVDADPLGLTMPDHPTSTSTGSTGTSDGAPTPERKASVDVDGTLDFHAAVEAKPKPPPPQHSISYEPPRVSHDAQTMQPVQPVERRASAQRRPDFFRHSVADATPQQPIPRMDRRPSETKSSIAAIANKFDATAQMERQQTAAISRRAPFVAPKNTVKEEQTRTFFRPLPPTYNFAAPPPPEEESKPMSRFNGNRKLRMKRANTIDIGRPLAGYRFDSDTDEDNQRAPNVPEFCPQTDNDRKFVAFMKKNEAAERDAVVNGGGPANWSNRFGNIKNAFESREREDQSRSSSASSSARRFWHTAEDTVPGVASVAPRGRRLFTESKPETVKPPWVTERREPSRVPPPQLSRQVPPPRMPPTTQPPAQILVPMLPQSPTRTGAKPFVARPIPVNQFSHAPLSAFKPPAKIMSPVSAPAHVWSPPSFGVTSPSTERAPPFPSSPRAFATSPSPPSWAPVVEPVWTVSPNANKPERNYSNGYSPAQTQPTTFDPPPPAPLTHAPPPKQVTPRTLTQNYPVKAIPSQHNLSAPELVRRMNGENNPADSLPEVDAQRLQIEFYERQIREKRRREAREPPPPSQRKDQIHKPPPPAGYTITDFTPHGGVSTFMPLQRTPDIEKARAHKIDYLPDVVTNETDRPRTPAAPHAVPGPRSPRQADLPPAVHNGDAHEHHENAHEHHENTQEPATEHSVAVARVMRGPVRGAATVTAGVRTRGDSAPTPADALRGTLDKLSSPKREALAHIERKKRSQVLRAPAPAGRSPPPVSTPHVRPSPPSLGASRESIASSESFTSAGALSRSGSWHQLSPASYKSASTSPRRVVSRAKSMHLLAVPKLFEGGIAREEVTEKRRTVEAYFAGAPQPALAPAPLRRPGGRSHQFALGRSHTMAAVSELQFLDESNADDAFEDLSPQSPQSPRSPSAAQPYFKFTDPALQSSARTIKERLLQWCRDKTRDYENVKLENFSTSWADGLAFCALLHHFLPDAFDYSQLAPDRRRHNFTLAFKVADEKAGIYPLLDVEDMVTMRKPDWKCVFTYVQSIHRRFKDEL